MLSAMGTTCPLTASGRNVRAPYCRSLLSTDTIRSAVVLTAVCRGHAVRYGDNMSPDRQRTERPRSLPSATPSTDTVRSAVMLTAVCRGHAVREGEVTSALQCVGGRSAGQGSLVSMCFWMESRKASDSSSSSVRRLMPPAAPRSCWTTNSASERALSHCLRAM
jgi:hypothetical protein